MLDAAISEDEIDAWALPDPGQFLRDLADLNSVLAASLRSYDLPIALSGNLFYAHLQKDFPNVPINAKRRAKRLNFANVVRGSKTLFEVGVNGGHSILLAKSVSPKLKVVGVDIARQLAPTWGPTHIYVPVAMAWLSERFGGMEFHIGDSRIEAPRYALSPNSKRIEVVHLDGAKGTHLQELISLRPALAKDARIILDDAHNRKVQRGLDMILRLGAFSHDPDYGGEFKSTDHFVLRYTSGR